MAAPGRDLHADRGDGGRGDVVRLPYHPPYDWGHVRAFLAARAIPLIERVDEDGYARTVATAKGHAVIRVRPVVGEDGLEMRGTSEATAVATARRMFDVDADPAGIAAAFRKDKLLAPLVRRRPGLRVVGAWDAFECAVRAVVGQQVSVAAARTFMTRLVTSFGQRIEGELTHLFPTPAALAAANLDGIGLTRARAATLTGLARAACAEAFDYRALAELPGIGEWTASYVALRALGDRDAFLAGDLVLRKMAGLPAKALAARAEAWRPWRGYAVFQLWRASNAPSEREIARRERMKRNG